MSIMRNDIPILEYDSDPESVIMPGHEGLKMRLPRKAVFPFLGEAVDQYAKEHGAKAVAFFESATKDFPVYILEIEGQELCLMQAPVGAPCAVQLLDWLISYGVREVISAGSCGVLEAMEENVFLVPSRALRDEGTSYHYLPPSRFVEVSKEARRAIEITLEGRGLSYQEVMTWTTDGFYRETKEKIRLRKSEGCQVVEMECAALAACAQMRGIIWGELLYTADTLADVSHYEERSWGRDSVNYALELCMEIACNL